mgnify:CR=1 FL=1
MSGRALALGPAARLVARADDGFWTPSASLLAPAARRLIVLILCTRSSRRHRRQPRRGDRDSPRRRPRLQPESRLARTRPCAHLHRHVRRQDRQARHRHRGRRRRADRPRRRRHVDLDPRGPFPGRDGHARVLGLLVRRCTLEPDREALRRRGKQRIRARCQPRIVVLFARTTSTDVVAGRGVLVGRSSALLVGLHADPRHPEQHDQRLGARLCAADAEPAPSSRQHRAASQLHASRRRLVSTLSFFWTISSCSTDSPSPAGRPLRPPRRPLLRQARRQAHPRRPPCPTGSASRRRPSAQ